MMQWTTPPVRRKCSLISSSGATSPRVVPRCGEVEGWHGGDYDKVRLRSEGERVAARRQNARADVLWTMPSRVGGVYKPGDAKDFGAGPARTWRRS